MRFAALLLAALLLSCVFIPCLHPAYPIDDSPETVAACVNLSTQHAPGYPFATIAGKAATLVPAGGPYLRLNLLSSLAAAASCVTVMAIVHALFPSPAGLLPGFAAGAALGVSRLFWAEALSAKGFIYHLNLLLTLLLLLSVIRGRRGDRGVPPGAFLLFGLGLANHWMSMLWWLPALVFPPARWTVRRAALAALLTLIGLSLYAQLPLSAERFPSWGDAASFRHFAEIVTRQEFTAHAVSKAPELTLLQLGWGLLLPLREGTAFFMLFALAGWAALWRIRRDAFVAAAPGALLTVLAVSFVANPVQSGTDELVLWFTEPFYLPWLGVSAVAAGAGIHLLLAALPARAARTAGFVVAAAPLALFALHHGACNRSRDYLGFDYAENMRARLVSPATILAEADFGSWPLYTLGYVEERLPGVQIVMTMPFLTRPWGWEHLARRLPEARRVLEAGERGKDGVIMLANLLDRKGPVFHHTKCTVEAIEARLAFNGLLYRVAPAGTAVSPPGEAEVSVLFRRLRRRGLFSPDAARDPLTLTALDEYAVLRAKPGERERMAGNVENALMFYRRAARYPGRLGLARIWRNAGIACAILGRDAEAEQAFRAAVRLRSHDAELWSNLGVACARQGREREAARYQEYAAKLKRKG